MSKLHNCLVEHAKFPFPPLNEHLSSSTDISTLDVDFLEREWKAKLAVRDNTLVQKLCGALEDILMDRVGPLTEDEEQYLLESFSPKIRFGRLGGEDKKWSTNSDEAQTRRLLDKGFFDAASNFFWIYNQSTFETTPEHLAQRGAFKVDYLALLKWVHGQPLVPKILSKAALCLGLRKMQWLFLTCHNYWIVCHSSEPFRVFLGAILSVVNNVPVESSAYNPNIQLDTIKEEQDDDPSPEYGSPMTRSHDRNSRGNTMSELLVTSSSPKSPENFQVWTRLYTMSNNVLAIPPCTSNDKLRLWFTRFIAVGSTGNVWQCHFDTSYDSFAAKIVEVLRPSDTEKRKRLRNEFKIHLILDKAYQSGRLHDHIAPRCYRAFESSHMDVLILDLCDGVLNSWGDLSTSERSDIYKLVQTLHSIGIVHQDLDPRNIGRSHGGGFFLIDFSESRKHVCKESKKCYELQTLRKLLWEQQPL
ncbi:hypothetical protein BJV74DRAFT_878456 [Russula compacta]|nr:hypothetical protein BJV74DRAFT_878456 [Russula compacta]